ncbi:MAG: glycoside hydrolase family 16 protein [Proteobacteria bacterium]|nr:glycoside hydrolase family 16 protein [Pseudomonadota bacterium]
MYLLTRALISIDLLVISTVRVVAMILISLFITSCSLLENIQEQVISVFPEKAIQWKLVWSDEFNGNNLDMSKWTFNVGGNGWGNNELQYYTDGSNIKVLGGKLIIEARKMPFGGNEYTSARISTQGKASWTYGRIEARIKLPYGQGIWPAFWMLGENIDSAGHPNCGEIDIMEMVGSADGVENATIWGSLHRPNLSATESNEIKSETAFYKNVHGNWFNDDFHVFGIQWSSGQIQFYVDNHLYKKVRIPVSGKDGYSVFRKPFFIILNLAVGGDWPGAPDATTDWPKQMEVDWVRVYTIQLGSDQIL